MLWELDFSIFHTSLQIKSQKLVVFVVQLSRIFHYYNIDWREHRGFDSKDTINFSQQTHILLQIKVIYQVIKHVEQYLFFLAFKGFNDILIISRKKEKRPTSALSLPRVEYVFDVFLNVKRPNYICRINLV